MNLINDYIALMPSLTASFIIRMLLEILIIWFIAYEFFTWIRSTQAWVLLKGIIVVIIFTGIVYLLQLNTILYLLDKAAVVFLLALLIIFQPELRKALERVGNSNALIYRLIPFKGDKKEDTDIKTYQEIADAAYKMGSKCTGALIVIQREQSLSDIDETGIRVNADITSQLLINIFEKNTPLHDGALTIENNRVAYATCYLPLSNNMNISKDLGTRHRAALGISEVRDAVTVVVSEETGNVSLVKNGNIEVVKSEQELINKLLEK